MSGPLDVWWVHPLVLERKVGTGAYGDQFDPPVSLKGFVERRTQQVRDLDGNEVVSTSSVALDVCVADVPPGSRVTTDDGRVSRVITSSRATGPGFVPAHLELSLT